MTLLIGIILLLFCIVKFAHHKGAVLIITTVKGFMVGALYNCDLWEDEEVKEHTIQICLAFVTITIQWDQKIGLVK
jgi:hypothetical protein